MSSRLRTAASVLVLLLALSGCGGDGDSAPSGTGTGAGAGSGSGDASADGTGAGGADAEGGGAGIEGAPGTEALSGQGSAAAGGGQDPAARVGVTPPGRHTYRLGGPSSDVERLLDVADMPDQPPEGVRQVHLWRDEEELLQREVVWGSDGRLLSIREQKARPEGAGKLCVWDPSYVEVVRGGEPGTAHEFSSRCTSDDDQGSALTTVRSGSVVVDGTEHITVQGRTHEAMRQVRKVRTLTSGSGLEVSEERDDTVWVSVRFGVVLKAEGEARTVVNGVTRSRTRVLETLISDPAKPIPLSET